MEVRASISSLILKRAPIGDNPEDYDVLEDGVVIGRIFLLSAVAPEGRPWMWASGHSANSVARAAHGYEPTREAAMAAFKKSWRRSSRAAPIGKVSQLAYLPRTRPPS